MRHVLVVVLLGTLAMSGCAVTSAESKPAVHSGGWAEKTAKEKTAEGEKVYIGGWTQADIDRMDKIGLQELAQMYASARANGTLSKMLQSEIDWRTWKGVEFWEWDLIKRGELRVGMSGAREVLSEAGGLLL